MQSLVNVQNGMYFKERKGIRVKTKYSKIFILKLHEGGEAAGVWL